MFVSSDLTFYIEASGILGLMVAACCRVEFAPDRYNSEHLGLAPEGIAAV
jgi:hypothetical protein